MSGGSPSGALVRHTCPDSGRDAHEQLLKSSLEGGIITQQSHDDQLRAHRGVQGTVSVPLRAHGDKLVPHKTGLWTFAAGPFPDRKAAFAKKTTVGHGRWVWNRSGDHKTNRCNAHIDCPVELSAVSGADGVYLQVLDVAHSLTPKEYNRKNSCFTVDQESKLLERTDAGKRPAQMMMQDALAAVKSNPYHAKRPDGGLEGDESTEPASFVQCWCAFSLMHTTTDHEHIVLYCTILHYTTILQYTYYTHLLKLLHIMSSYHTHLVILQHIV